MTKKYDYKFDEKETWNSFTFLFLLINLKKSPSP